METLGELLRKEREFQNKDLKKIAKDLKISSRYLEALEADKFDEIDLADIYKKGILKNYARYLKIDEKLVLDLYNQQYEKPIQEEIKREEKKERSFVFVIYIIVGIIILSSFYITYKTTTKPTVIPQPLSTYTPIIPTIPSQKETILTPTIKVVAFERTWIRAIYENKIIFEGILKEGDIKTWTYPYLNLHIGNAGGIEIFYNERSLGVPGKKGEVIIKRVP
ncbi:MAG: helix-turn-helix domain-containing protein [Dictyoglomaceae bacterium]